MARSIHVIIRYHPFACRCACISESTNSSWNNDSPLGSSSGYDLRLLLRLAARLGGPVFDSRLDTSGVVENVWLLSPRRHLWPGRGVKQEADSALYATSSDTVLAQAAVIAVPLRRRLWGRLARFRM